MSHDVELSLWCHHQDVGSCGGILKKEKKKKDSCGGSLPEWQEAPKVDVDITSNHSVGILL
jgi:hypothetical protein